MLWLMHKRVTIPFPTPPRRGLSPEREPTRSAPSPESAFGYPRDFLENHFVYLVISPRAQGLSVGINLHPLAHCNLDCRYCEVHRPTSARAPEEALDVDRMVMELREVMELVRGGWLRQWPRYAHLPAELLAVRHVALSGDGEPTLSRQFAEAVRAVVAFRAREGHFKLVLSTNATALHHPSVQAGLTCLTRTDEIWAKLDGGTQAYVDLVNGVGTPLPQILRNILSVGRQRPVIIQSLFPAIDGEEPPAGEVQAYAERLKELRQAGAAIPLVQIYSANRPMARSGCTHLPLRTLSQIAQTVRRVAGLRAEVF